MIFSEREREKERYIIEREREIHNRERERDRRKEAARKNQKQFVVLCESYLEADFIAN